MKKISILLLLVFLSSFSCTAHAWQKDWDEGYDEGYEEGYDDGYRDGTDDPFYFDGDKAGAFGFWFLTQEWTDAEIHAWKAVFASVFDEKNRSWTVNDRPAFEAELSDEVLIAIVSGDYYHKSFDCHYLNAASYIVGVEREDAIQRGFIRCPKCVEYKTK